MKFERILSVGLLLNVLAPLSKAGRIEDWLAAGKSFAEKHGGKQNSSLSNYFLRKARFRLNLLIFSLPVTNTLPSFLNKTI